MTDPCIEEEEDDSEADNGSCDDYCQNDGDVMQTNQDLSTSAGNSSPQQCMSLKACSPSQKALRAHCE